jgi:hypothetical protein
MLLRLLVLTLIATNGLFYAWFNGHLNALGFAKPSQSQSESYRLAEQINPERITLQQSNHAIRAETVAAPLATVTTTALTLQAESALASLPKSCLTAGVLNDKQSTLLTQTLHAKMPNLSWRYDTVAMPARWIIYMGKYISDKQRELKKEQLKQLNVPYEVLTESSLELGLSLGSHATQAAANQALQKLIKQGVRTARVLQESPEQQGRVFVAPSVDDASRSKLETIYASLLTQLSNKALQVCK